MKKLLVTQRIIFDKKIKIFRDALDHQLVNFFYKNKFILIPIPNIDLSKKKLKIFLNKLTDLSEVHGVVLSGGNDIGEYYSRDLLEKCLLDISKRKKIPVFGICRGMQVMSKYYGINLKRIKGHVATRHLVFHEKNKKKKENGE